MYRYFFKRLFDFTIALISIILFSPLFVFLAILIKIKLGGPVIYKQERPGKKEKIFKLYKFRSMTNEKDSEGNLLPDAKRITSFGIKLRATSLDELPELFNILKGDMAIIGPRPLLVRYLPYYTEKERIRHSVRPGLTGLAQINGRNNITWEDRFDYDLKYVKKITFLRDLKIVFGTIRKVLSHSDVEIPGSDKFEEIKDLDVERAFIVDKVESKNQ